MKIRWKLLILLLLIALIPLVITTVLHGQLTRRLGRTLAADQWDNLEQLARRGLQHQVDEYAAILQREVELIELVVSVQAYEVEQRLAGAAPDGTGFLLADNFDHGGPIPDDAKPSDRHLAFDEEGKQVPMWVSYGHQAYKVVEGIDPRAVRPDMARLASMSEVYGLLRRGAPDVMKWQYTSLEAGIHTTYPGHGGYDPDYDPRIRDWYTRARDAEGELIWLVITDVTTSVVTGTAAKAVYWPDGRFAGVTAVDLPLSGLLGVLRMPGEWGQQAETMFVRRGMTGTEAEGKIAIVARSEYVDQQRNWRDPVRIDVLKCEDPAALEAITVEAEAGNSGVAKIPWQGQPALWAYGPAKEQGDGFPLVILSYDEIMAPAIRAQEFTISRTLQGLKIAGGTIVVVIIGVTVVALRSSRAVTRPVRELAHAAAELSHGHYNARAEVRTGDELEELGNAFNDVGPKLQERERMKASLELAMEIQQHLLPDHPPVLAGFDISGRSIYCDETGGDYFDCVDQDELGESKLGIALGDVTGHGISAALLMASARAVLRSHAQQRGGDLGDLMETLNQHLARDTDDKRFMTLFYCVLDAAEHTLRWASAGHDPALWYRSASDDFEEMPSTGIPLGVMDGMAYEERGPLTLSSGDVVVTATDGVWEAANTDGEMFGKDRLREIIAAHARRNAHDIEYAILDAVNRFLGPAPQEDDVTLVVIKVL